MRESDPRVAVLLPTLNGEAFIGEQLDALARQQVDVPWHLVVVDGGSTDGTLEVVRARTAGRMPIRIVELAGAPGVNAGLNAGVCATDSSLFAIAEHDDVVADGWLQALVHALSEHWLVGSHMERFLLNASDVTGARRNLPGEVQVGAPIANATGMGFRRDLWELLEGFDESYRYGGNDVEFCFRSYLVGHPLALVDGAKVHYRIRPDAGTLFRQSCAYGPAMVRLHVQFGAQLLPRRRASIVLRDYARLAYWAIRASTNRSYRMRFAFRAGLLFGYARGSLRYRTVYL